MKGSQKQIKWADSIKAGMDFEKNLGKGRDEKGNLVIEKAVNFVAAIEHASFWIDHRGQSEMQILSNLMAGGLQVKGYSFDHRAKMDEEGEITITWEEIVQDGKGGHKVTRTEKF